MLGFHINYRRAAQNLVLTSPAEVVPSHQSVQNLQDGEDESYVDSYSHFSIHQEMLQVFNLLLHLGCAVWWPKLYHRGSESETKHIIHGGGAYFREGGY